MQTLFHFINLYFNFKGLHNKLVQTQTGFSESLYNKQKKEINNILLEIDKQKHIMYDLLFKDNKKQRTKL